MSVRILNRPGCSFSRIKSVPTGLWLKTLKMVSPLTPLVEVMIKLPLARSCKVPSGIDGVDDDPHQG